jgi:hypothetical protein
MLGSFLNGMSRLERVIEALKKDLVRYSEKPDASEQYIKKQNDMITALVASFNDLDSMRYYETWEIVEDEMYKLEKIDPELNAHNILLQTRPGKTIHSRIVINPFKND